MQGKVFTVSGGYSEQVPGIVEADIIVVFMRFLDRHTDLGHMQLQRLV